MKAFAARCCLRSDRVHTRFVCTGSVLTAVGLHGSVGLGAGTATADGSDTDNMSGNEC